MKEDAVAIVLETAGAAGVGLDRLDIRVEALRDGIGDGMREVVEQTEELRLQRERDLPDRLELGAPRGPEPLSEKPGGAHRVGLGPELSEGLLVTPRAGSLEVALAQLGEAILADGVS